MKLIPQGIDPDVLRLKNYFAFMAPVSDYFVVMWHNKYLFLYEWAVPVLLAFLSIDSGGDGVLIKSFNLGFIVTLLGSLMAFSIALLTLILTFGQKVTESLKNRLTDVCVNGRQLSLYQLMFTNTSYSIVIEGILTMFTMFFMIHASWLSWISISIVILFTAQVILINMRTITNVYLVYMNPLQNLTAEENIHSHHSTKSNAQDKKNGRDDIPAIDE